MVKTLSFISHEDIEKLENYLHILPIQIHKDILAKHTIKHIKQILEYFMENYIVNLHDL